MAGLEGCAGPKLQRFRWLHVVVAVKQQMWPAAAGAGVVRQHDGVPGRGADLGLEADAGKLVSQPFRRLGAVGGVGRLGTDAGDPQQVEPPCLCGLPVRVEVLQDCGNVG